MRKLEIEVAKRTSEIAAQANRLQDLNHQKDKLIAIISHDIRNPLSSLKGITRLLDPRILSEEKLTQIRASMESQIDGLSASIVTLLDWAKAQLEGQVVHFESFELYRVVNEMCKFYSHRSQEKGITIVNETPDDLMVYADLNQLRTIFRNLVGNALKFTSKGDVITISASVNGNVVTIAVRDTGIGMSEAVVDGLFTVGGVSKKGTAGEVGTGLGLSLVDEFVRKNGGQLWVESEEGVGSTFYFTLPSHPDQ